MSMVQSIQQFKRKMNLTKMMVSLQVQVATFAVKSGNIWFGIPDNAGLLQGLYGTQAGNDAILNQVRRK